MQMKDRQKSWKVAKEALSKLLFHVQELKAAIEKQKVKWDVVQDNNFNVKGANITYSESSPMGDAIKASETKTSELLVALKHFKFEEFQTSKKADKQKIYVMHLKSELSKVKLNTCFPWKSL
jgi:hypothetical protein